MRAGKSASSWVVAALCVASLSLALGASASARTREPLARAYASLRGGGDGFDVHLRPDAAALREARRSRPLARVSGGDDVDISSGHYGQAEMDSVANTLASLEHGPELAQLSVYLATPAELAEICGATVLACYLPGEMEMVVSGIDRPIAGVPRDFAIAHEYGHHIANVSRSPFSTAIDVGTARWATYERVCQLTRAGHLFPGNQGAHYWQDPEEAFAESYAHLADPSAGVSWQYTPLLAPTPAALGKLRADVDHPWSGPTRLTVDGSVAEPAGAGGEGARSGRLAISAATVVGRPPWVAFRRIATPLDGTVSVAVQAPAGASLEVALRGVGGARVLARGVTGATGATEISYSNCGRDALELEVRSRHGSGAFEATVLRP